MTKKRRVRKPRAIWGKYLHCAVLDGLDDKPFVHVAASIPAKDCRRLAKWLERAASWIEAREGKR